jgi:hypothetical protein
VTLLTHLKGILSETHYDKIRLFLKQDENCFPKKASELDTELAKMFENSSLGHSIVDIEVDFSKNYGTVPQ